MSLPSILARMLAVQAELAATLANPQLQDMARRQAVSAEAARLAADFQRFVDRYQITVRKRPCAPAERSTEKPHCARCAEKRRGRG